MLAAAIAAWRRRLRLAGGFLVICVAWFYIAAAGFFGTALMSFLERDYPPMVLDEVPAADVILLLGGAVDSRAEGAQLGNLNRWADRVIFAAALYHAGKAPVILLSGGGALGAPSEAALMRDILLALAVPTTAIMLEQDSRTTYDNARFSAPIIREQGWQNVLLVTSAFHMRRSIAVFQRQGIPVIAAPTDHQFIDLPAVVMDWFPTIHGMARTTYAMHELVGYLVYRLQGKI